MNSQKLTSTELMDIIAGQLRKLSSTTLDDRNIMKCIAQSKEVGNLAGKAISLAAIEVEKQRIGAQSENLLPEAKKVNYNIDNQPM